MRSCIKFPGQPYFAISQGGFMRIFGEKIYDICLKFLQIIVMVLTAFLFVGGFLFTCYAENMETQQVLTRWDNPLWNVLGCVILLGVLGIVTFLIAKNAGKWKKLLLMVTLGWIILVGVVLILFSKTVPAADAMSVYAAAEALAGGDTSVIHPTDSYLSYYPQQVGLMAFLEVLFRIWNLFGISMPAYHFVKGIYVLLLCAAIVFQYKSVHLLWKNDVVDCLYLLLAGANFPMIMYSSFVYGEIPSFAAFSVGLFYLLKFRAISGHGFLANTEATAPQPSAIVSKIPTAACSVLFLALSVMLRKNSLILIIAVLLVLTLEWLKSKRHALLLLAVLCAISSFGILPMVQKSYELRSGNTLKTGVPAMSYFAMGMQEASRGNGWYNGFNINTYQATGMDTEQTNEISKQAIAERMAYFRSHPGYAVNFYFHKHLSQWADGTYASRQATLATFGGRHEIFKSLYEGKLSSYYISYCNTYQNVLYLGAFLFCLCQLLLSRHSSRLTNLPMYIGLIGVLGGFLFHIIWEANSRYIFVYGLLLLPYAAKGLSSFATTRVSESLHIFYK